MRLFAFFCLLGLSASGRAPDGAGERIVSIGFDDFRDSDFSLVAPLFRAYGATATFNVPHNPEYAAHIVDGVRILEAQGHEIGDHTWYHWNGLFDDPRMNGQNPASPEGGQVPFPSNDEMRADRGDGKNAFGFPLTDRVDGRLREFWSYGGPSFSAVQNVWGRLTDAECQRIRDYFSVYSGTCGFLETFDRLSNRHLGTTGRSHGSWSAEKGCYTGGIFTGCRTSANHEIWERVLQLTRAVYREACRTNFTFATWSWPGCYSSPFVFERDGRFFYDAARTLPANALARFPSSLRRDAGGKPLARSFTEALRSEGYVTTHDMTYPSRRDGTERTAMRRQLFANAGFSRRDALAYSTDTTVRYTVIDKEYPPSFFGGDTNNAAAKMYDGGGSYRAFVEAVRHETASGLVHGEVIDSEDTFSERIFLDRALAFCRAAGVRVCSKREAYEACFARTNTCGNLIRNPGFRNSAAEFLPGARTVPASPDGYLGACHVEAVSGGVRRLVTEGPVTNVLYGVPPGPLVYSAKVRGTGRIRIHVLRNRSAFSLEGLETLSALDVAASSPASRTVRFTVPDAPETPYEARWEGLGEKVMGLVFVYPPGLELEDIRLVSERERR